MKNTGSISLVTQSDSGTGLKEIKENCVSRRRFLKYSFFMSASIASAPLFFSGCAVNPVSGRQEIMMVSRGQEIAIDKSQSVFQFSADYGITQDQKINNYLGTIGRRLLPHVQRPGMPYNFHCVNAVYINAYAFPGGSIAATRGILLKLENEAQLASLLGHELGHVNARHAAEQITSGQISSLIVGGLTMAAGSRSDSLGEITQRLGMLGQGLLLSKYSRDNERQADSLGNEYMVKAGYPSKGFVGLMRILNSLNRKNQERSQILFASHPMSSKRLISAIQRDKKLYKYSDTYPLFRERFMDNTISLRVKKHGIELLQQGEKKLASKDYYRAESIFKQALGQLNRDYTAHVLMAKCQMIMKKPSRALFYASRAKKLYPTEVQAHYISGLANKDIGKYSMAYRDFADCDRLLPGNPQITFYKGYCRDKTGDRRMAAFFYASYLKMVNYKSGKHSRYAYNRLKKWGYVK